MTKLLAVFVLLLLGLAVACQDEKEPFVIPSPGLTVTFGDSPVPDETPPLGVCQPNPDPATAEFQVIDQPLSQDTVTSPVTISGQILAFEATYRVSIYDASVDLIAEQSGTAEAVDAGQLAPFTIDLPFQVTEETPACIWVYELSAMDNSTIHVGQIPVTLSP